MRLYDFLNQDKHLEAFITGPAGSGKTTKLRDVIKEVNEYFINYKVVAFTHKAKEVLEKKLPINTPIHTLHSWLRKTPDINSEAEHVKNLMITKQHGKPDFLELLIVDEFSFIGQSDYNSITDLQDPLLLEVEECKNCGALKENLKMAVDGSLKPCCFENRDLDNFRTRHIKPLKVLYVGDLNQLSPIYGKSAIEPYEPFWEKLTKIHRTKSDISEPLKNLVSMIKGDKPMTYLEPTKDFNRGVDIDKAYKEDEKDKIMLAYTNKAVQLHNKNIAGKKLPDVGDNIHSSNLNLTFEVLDIKDTVDKGDICIYNKARDFIDSETKYKPLELLNKLDYIKFYLFETHKDGTNVYIPGIFGNYENKIIRDKLAKNLVNKNRKKQDSKKEFRAYKTINDYTSILDFTHCMTVHKSQGSEFENVYIDSKDLSICIDKQERMKLLYVAMSRSKNKIFLNN